MNTPSRQPVLVQSVQPNKLVPVRFTVAEKLQILGFFVVHTILVLGVVLRLTIGMEHRLTSIEIGQEAVAKTITEIRLDVRELRARER